MTNLTGVSGLELQQLQVTLAEDKEWNETTKTLSKMGSLIVQAVATYLTAGAGSGLAAGISNAALKAATSAAINSLSRQVVSGILTAAITGNGLNLDLGDLARNALKSGVSAGLNMELAENLQNTPDMVNFTLSSVGQAGIQSTLYGSHFKDALIANATGKATDKAFNYVGDEAMARAFGVDASTFEDGGLGKTLMHATAGGTASLLMGKDFATGAAAAGAREALSPLSADLSDDGQQLVSNLIGITVGKMVGGDRGAEVGSTIALSAEINNRQLHQKEIAWIEEHAEGFAKEQGISVEEAKYLLSAGALDKVDGLTHNLINLGKINVDADKLSDAQSYIDENSKGMTFFNQHHTSDTYDYEQDMFTVNSKEEYYSNINPNESTGLGVSPALEFISPLGKIGSIKGVKNLGKGKVEVTLDGGKRVVVPEGAIVKGSDGSVSIDPSKVRHSQKTVSFKKKRGDIEYTYDDIKNSMQKEGWQGEPIDVVKMPDGGLTSIDNTRVRGAKVTNTPIKANIRKYDEPLSDADKTRFRKRNSKGQVIENPQTWGEAIEYRIKRQGSTWSRENPHGTHELPRLTGKPED